jgi:hypothetical protein
VFLTPNGDCKGLYVASKTAGGFEVRELGGGTSNISFDYRIVAKRLGFENARMEDVTERMNALRAAHPKGQPSDSAHRLTVPPQPRALKTEEKTPQAPQPVALSTPKLLTTPRR